MGTKLIVTDVDNTILRAERRLMRVLRDLGWEELFPELRARYDGVQALLGPEEQERFYEVFLSDRYLELDEPLPGAAATLRALREAGYKIVYLTGRHDAPGDSMRRGTERWLAEHGFPHPGDGSTLLSMKPRRRMEDRAFKEEALKEILRLGCVRAGIGDRPSDGEAYLRQEIPAILLRNDHYTLRATAGTSSEEELRAAGDLVPGSFLGVGVQVVRDWTELRGLLLGEKG